MIKKVKLSVVKETLTSQYLFKKDIERNKYLQQTGKYFDLVFQTKESFSVSDLLVIKDYLNDQLFDKKVNSPCWRKLKRRLDCVSHVLALRSKENLYIEKGYFTRTVWYGYLKKHKIGRIYPMFKSVPYFPRDLRYMLFGKTYIDVDLVNSHPSILYHFCVNHTSFQAPVLKRLVIDRETVREQIAKELGSTFEIKKKIIIALNVIPESFNSPSGSLRTLNREISKIREAIYHFLEKEGKMIELDSTNSFSRNLVTIQAHYCGTMESELLLKLKYYLENIEQVKVNIQGFHFIPLFDGAYIKHEDCLIHSQLKDYIKKFYLEFFKFEIKEPSFDDTYIDLNLIKQYQIIRLFLSSIDLSEFSELLKKLSIDPFVLPDSLLSRLNADRISNNKEISQLKSTIYSIGKDLKKKSITLEVKKDLENKLEFFEGRKSKLPPKGMINTELQKEVCEEANKFARSIRLKLLSEIEQNGDLDHLKNHIKQIRK